MHDRLRVIEAASILLFFLQALRAIFSVLFGIIYDQLFAGSPDAWLPLSILLVLAALLGPGYLPRLAGRAPLFSWVGLAAVGRVLLTVNQAEVRFWSALVVIAAGGVYLAAMMLQERRAVFPALLLALGADQMLRAAGHTYDLSLRGGWLPVQVVWSALIIILAVRLARRPSTAPVESGAPGILWGLAFGAALFLETSLLSLPNAVSGWSGVSYAIAAPVLFGLTWLAFGLWGETLRALRRSFPARLALALLLPAGLLAGYFLPGIVGILGLFLAHASALALLALLLGTGSGGKRAPGPSLAAGMALFLFLNFFNAFAFTYPYSLPFMRGLGWAVYLAAGLAGALGLLAVGRVRVLSEEPTLPHGPFPAAGLVGLALVAFFAWPRPALPQPPGEPLRLATYNIHYGYDSEWRFTLEEIARTIEAEGVDVAALQEVDTGRLTSYGVDNALYLARRLRMNVFYLLAVERLTGIAVLYRGPASGMEGRLLPSLQEQTGIIRVQLEPGGPPVHFFGIWMGLSNEDTERQIEAALAFIGDHAPAAFGGDFNALPDSPVAQAVRSAGFDDPFELLGIDPPPTDPAIDPRKRIDYVWLRGLVPARAWVAESLASDHRMVVVELER